MLCSIDKVCTMANLANLGTEAVTLGSNPLNVGISTPFYGK